MIFDPILIYIRVFIAAIGVAVIAFGALRGIRELFMAVVHQDFDANFIRFKFGTSVILGLEFIVGADIIGSLIDPDYYRLGLLAIMVVIRTILSYFISLELKQLTPQERKAIK